MNIWKILIAKEKIQFYFLNWLAGIFKFLKTKNRRKLKRSNGLIRNGLSKASRVTIVMNGPSVNNQDLSLLKGEDVIFGNRGFKHELYKEIHPKFHVFVDPKLKQGIWPVSWLDEILEMVPDITFVMPAEWADLDFLQPYINRGIKILWLFDNHTFIGGMGVAGAAMRAAINVGYKEIYITGFEKTGFANELLKSASHFYGTNTENSLKTWYDYTLDFYMNFLFYVGAQEEANNWKRKEINIYNVTDGGLVEVFPRRNFSEVYGK